MPTGTNTAPAEQPLMDGLLHASELNRKEISDIVTRISQRVFKLTGEMGPDAEPIQDKAGVKEAGSLHAKFCYLSEEYVVILKRLQEIDELLFRYTG